MLPRMDGATHPYVGASSACWTRFAEVSARLPVAGDGEGTVAAGPLARLVIDAYMVQHPGVPERRAIQSVGVHLVALCLVLEHGLAPERVSSMVQRVLARAPAWRWLEPPDPNGDLTIVDVADALASSDAAPRVEDYVRGIWRAWAHHHPTVEEWAATFV